VSADDSTLGGYVDVHGRPPAFEGTDGKAYSAGIYSDDDPGPDGRFGAALLFIEWSERQEPVGHLETEFLIYDTDAVAAEAAVGRMSLDAVKSALDRLIAVRDGARA
jgi:hypothetical protein